MKQAPPLHPLHLLRQQYSAAELTQASVAKDPVAQFKLWFEQAGEAGIEQPNAMLLATVSSGGAPSQRTVLMKGFDQHGFVLFTNHGSRKAQQMHANHAVCVVFPWYALQRQVLIEGNVERVDEQSSRDYFHTRPREAQVGAWASRQSEVLASKQVLSERVARITERFHRQEVPLPQFWGGYRICPQRFEFWQGRAHRLHDRILYLRQPPANWQISRLSP